MNFFIYDNSLLYVAIYSNKKKNKSTFKKLVFNIDHITFKFK